MEYEELKAQLDTHCCAQCDAPLTLVWDAEAKIHKLVCGDDRSHAGIKPLESLSQAVARGKADELVGPGAQRDLERSLAKAAHPLSMMPRADLSTGAALTKEALVALVKWGESLGFKPYLGHVCLYKGKPYPTIDGFYYKLREKVEKLAVGTRPLTKEEFTTYQIPEGAYAWLAEAWLGTTKLPTTGLGIVTKEEIEGKSDKHPEQWRSPVAHGHPQRMAEKRAEWQLLRKLIPLEEVKRNDT